MRCEPDLSVGSERRQSAGRNVRSGISLIELLVSISVVGILLALLVPAVIAARDTARRVDCQNRIRQFGLALHQFEQSYRHLPVGTIFDPRTGNSTPWRSPQVQLLPFLEQAALFERIDKEPEMQVLHLGSTIELPAFHCPSESIATGVNYRACTGSNVGFFDEAGAEGELARGKGALAGVSSLTPIALSSISDGLSNTAAMSERTISQMTRTAYDSKRDIWMTNAMSLGFDPEQRAADETVELCRAALSAPPVYYASSAGHNFVKDSYLYTGYNHVLTPNTAIPDCVLDRFAAESWPAAGLMVADWGAVGARSLHRDGTVSLLMLDGSVRFVSSEIDTGAWRAFGSRSEGD
ncbi:MAG: DUF1559 domain-containing protein [Planctomycetota bacterium]